MLALLNSEAYRDLAIPQVWARELDEGRFWCSQSSMYRIAREVGQSRELPPSFTAVEVSGRHAGA